MGDSGGSTKHLGEQFVVDDGHGRGQYVAAPGSRDTHLRFTARGQTFIAEIVDGPGGNFLSNEVAFHTQRQLGASGSSVTSFHVHTPGEDANLDELVDTLRSIVRSVIRHRPAPTTPSRP